MTPKVLIMSGYGINCEKESAHAFEKVGAKCEIIHVNDLISKKKFLKDYDIIMFPGGFSYGDDTGSGNAFANKIKNNLWNELLEFINSDKLILGVCNGFQIMTHLGLFSLPDTEYGKRIYSMESNSNNRYICRWVNIKAEETNCIWTKNIDTNHIPIAHGEGRFTCDDETLRKLENSNQIVFRYSDSNGNVINNPSINPNGSKSNIAGICDKSGRIMGMMPHPERGLYSINEPDFHLKKELAKRNGEIVPEIVANNFKIFQNAVNYFNKKGDEISYKDSGVNIEAGDEASKILYNAAKETWINRKENIGELIVPFDDFSGVRGINISNLPEGSFMSMGFDGIGTKVEIAQRMNNHKTIAFDLFAMVCDDAIVRGAEPVLIGSVLDVNSLGEGEENIKALKELAEGYISAAKESNVAVINGEMAELGNAVGGFGNFKYNWSSALIWFANKKNLFTGREINVGDYIVAFREKGFRSNGLSLVRKILGTKYGTEWHNLDLEGEKLGDLVLTPSKIYSKAIVNMHGGFQTSGTCKINGVSHITGGGIPGKLRRVLKPSGFGAILDNLFEPSKIMLHCQKLGNVNDEEAYKTWNMGQGLLVITPEPIKVIEEAQRFNIDAQVCGKIAENSEIKIMSKGKDKKELIFN